MSSEVFPASKHSTLCKVFNDVIGDPYNEIINLKPLNFGAPLELSPQEALRADYKKQLMSRRFWISQEDLENAQFCLRL